MKGGVQSRECTRPPEGWTCSRGAGHDGPCLPAPVSAATGFPVRDGLIVQTSIRFGWRDRLRILFHGRATVRTETATEHFIGSYITTSTTVCAHRALLRRARAGEGSTHEIHSRGNA
jgi:hypothetical protein